jgi:hypothetical protein
MRSSPSLRKSRSRRQNSRRDGFPSGARGKESPRRIRAVVVMRHGLGDHGFRLDFDFDLGSLFELYLLSICVGQTVWNTDLSIEVICSLDSNLSFFGFARAGMRMDYLFDSPWERSTCLRRFTRHNDPPLPFGFPTHSRQKPLLQTTIVSGVSSRRHPGNTVGDRENWARRINGACSRTCNSSSEPHQ